MQKSLKVNRPGAPGLARVLCFVLALLLVQGGWLAPLRAAENAEVVPENFKLVAESDEARLLYNRREALFRVESRATGQFYDTKALEGTGGNQFTRNIRQSDLVFEYIRDLRTGLMETVDNYSMAIGFRQYEAEEIEDGLRMRYVLGEEKITLGDLPKYIEPQRMYDLVLSHLSDKQRKTLEDEYTIVGGRYVRRSDKGVAQLKIDRLYEYFYEVGEYTPEDLALDNETWGVEASDDQLRIEAALDYQLDGKDLVVSFPMSELHAAPEHPISRVRVLPYLLSAAAGQEGYLVVPDGSGAILNFDNGKRTASNFSGRVYGKDVLRNVTEYGAPVPALHFPMAAIKYEDYALLAIIEEGAEMAQLQTEVSGKADEFNKATFTFNLKEIEQVESLGDSSITLPRASSDDFTGEIRIRYRMLEADDATGDDLSYVDIAKAYQSYLLERGLLEEPESPQYNTALNLEFLNSIRKKQFFLGIPSMKNIALTSFDESREILEDLRAEGIDEITAELVGFANRGINHGSVAKIRPEGVLGGRASLESLLDYASSQEGIELYPALYLTQVYGKRGLTLSRDVSRMLSGEYAQLPVIDHVKRESKIQPKLSPYLLSPHFYQDYDQDVLKSAAELGIDHLSILDLGSLLIPDYTTRRDTQRWTARGLQEDALALLSEKLSKRLFSNPFDYALPYASGATDIPLDHSGNGSFDYEIPFVQMVLGGKLPYAGEAVNRELLESPQALFLKSIESRTAPRFQLMARENAIVKNTDFENLFATNYEDMKARILDFHRAYLAVMEEIGERELISHEVKGDLRRLVYGDPLSAPDAAGANDPKGANDANNPNGANDAQDRGRVTLLINYGDTPAEIDGHVLEPLNYLIIEEGR